MECTDCGHETMHSKTKLIGTGFMAKEVDGCCEETGCQCTKFETITDKQAQDNLKRIG